MSVTSALIVVFYSFSTVVLTKNTVEKTPHMSGMRVICSAETIGLFVSNTSILTFSGDQPVRRIFSSRHQRDAACSYGVVQPATALRFELPYTSTSCGVVSRRLTRPAAGLKHAVRLIVSYSPTELTEDDRAFEIKCRYFVDRQPPVVSDIREFDLIPLTRLPAGVQPSLSHVAMVAASEPVGVMTADIVDARLQLTVGETVRWRPASSIAGASSVAGPPRCDYTLRLDSLNGPVVESAEVGQKIFHRWQCDGDAYGLKVYECAVQDGAGRRYPLIDRHGCSTNASIMPRVVYAADRRLAYAPSHVFRFSNASRIFFHCLMYICQKQDANCRWTSQQQCDNSSPTLRRVKRRVIPWDSPHGVSAYVNVQSSRSASTVAGGPIVSYDIRPASVSDRGRVLQMRDDDEDDDALMLDLLDFESLDADRMNAARDQDPENVIHNGNITLKIVDHPTETNTKRKMMGTTNSGGPAKNCNERLETVHARSHSTISPWSVRVTKVGNRKNNSSERNSTTVSTETNLNDIVNNQLDPSRQSFSIEMNPNELSTADGTVALMSTVIASTTTVNPSTNSYITPEMSLELVTADMPANGEVYKFMARDTPRVERDGDIAERRRRLETIILSSGTSASTCENQTRQLRSLRRTIIVLSAVCLVALCATAAAITSAFRRRLRTRFVVHDSVRLD